MYYRWRKAGPAIFRQLVKELPARNEILNFVNERMSERETCPLANSARERGALGFHLFPPPTLRLASSYAEGEPHRK